MELLKYFSMSKTLFNVSFRMNSSPWRSEQLPALSLNFLITSTGTAKIWNETSVLVLMRHFSFQHKVQK